MSKACCTHWFLRKVMRHLVNAHGGAIYMGRMILKHTLYREFSQWYHFRREETMDVLQMLARAFEGVTLAKHGLLIPVTYLKEYRQRKATKKPTGAGGQSGVGQ